MNKELNCNKVGIELCKVDFEKLGRVGNKVIDLLSRKINDPLHGYLLLKSLCILFEDSLGVHLESEEERKLRNMIVKATEDFEG